MTYLQFLLLFLGVPLLIFGPKFNRSNLPNKKEFLKGIFILIILAVTYTTPWDNYLVKSGVWIYGNGRILGTIGYVPIEEYCFFILQPLLSGIVCFLLQKQFSIQKGVGKKIWSQLISLLYVGLLFFGFTALYFEKTRYLGLILSWAMPVILLQWLVGGKKLLKNGKIFLAALIIPTLYFWIADALAIFWGIWSISEKFTTGLKVAGLPLEEALFFLVTNLMLVQGVILFVVMEEEMTKLFAAKRRVLRWIGFPG